MKSNITKVIIPLVLLALIVASSLISLRPLAVAGPEPAVQSGAMEAGLRAVVREKVNESGRRYLSAQESDARATRLRIKTILAEARKEARIQAAHSARPFQGFGNATWTVKLGVQQQLGGGSELSDYTVRALRPATGMLSRTERKLIVIVSGFRDRSAARSNDYRKEVLSFAADAGLEPEDIDIDAAVFDGVAAAVNDLVSQTMSAGISIGLEAALVASTRKAIWNVLGPVIRKAAKTLGVSGVLVVADGPLPVGDVIAGVIAAGGTAWTAHDIHKAVRENKRLPGKIEASLRSQIDRLVRSANQAVDQIDPAFAELYRNPA